MRSSGLTFFLAIPLLLTLNLPVATGGYGAAAAVLAAYALALAAAFRIMAGSGWKRPGSAWTRLRRNGDPNV